MSDDTAGALTVKDVAKSPAGLAGLACALLPFFVHVTSSNTRTVNGVVVSDFFRDYPAIVLGAAGLVLGLLLLARGDGPMKARGPVGGLVLVLSAWHLVTGFGLDRATGEAPPEVAEAGVGVPQGVALACSAANLAACEARCAEGSAETCNNLGAVYTRGQEVPEDEAKALTFFDKACAGGSKYGCSNAAAVLFTGKPPQPERALEYWKKGCELKDADVCNGLGVKFDHGDGVPEDEAAAFRYFEKACDLGNGLGCKNAGFMVSEGRGTPQDAKCASDFYRRACDGKEPSGCTELGLVHSKKDEIDQATAMFTRACDGKDALGCTNLGITLAAGGTGDLAKARPAYERGCEGRNARACFELGLLHDEGLGGLAKNATAAVSLYDKACSLGSATGCVNAGVSYRDGDGVARDELAATERFEVACTKLESKDGCFRLGLVLAPQEPERARAILTPFCDVEKNTQACAALKTLKKARVSR